MTIPFSEIVYTQKGKNPSVKSKKKLDGYIPYVDIKAFEQGIFETYTNGKGCLFCDDGDVLLVWDGARAGLTGIAYKGAVGSTLVKIDVPLVEKKYILFFLQYYYRELNAKPKGTGIPHINPNVFDSLPFPLPPLPEQHRIIEKIDTLFSELDNGETLLKTIKAQLAVYRQSVLMFAFEGKLTNSKIFKEENLRKFIENPRYGTSKKCIPENSGTKVYRIPNINFYDGTILQDNLKYAMFSEDEKESLQLKKDDVLIIRSNGSINLVGRASIVRDDDTDGIFAGYLMRLRIITNNLIPKYLLHYLSSFNARSYIETTAKSTSGVNNINSDEIGKLKIPCFDIPEQLAIVSAIESRLSVCDKLEQTVDQTLALSASLRQSILKKAFEGRLVPQDPNDEPAEKLLERIKAEKVAILAKQKQTRKRGKK